jgi:hypothetical protein
LPFPFVGLAGAGDIAGEALTAGAALPFPFAGLVGAGCIAGEALTTGAAVAAGAGEVAGAAVAVGGALPAAAPLLGGGIFFASSVFIFCCNCALAFGSETPDHPVSNLGCAIFVFTTFGATVGGAFLTVIGAATTSLPPSTLVAEAA